NREPRVSLTSEVKHLATRDRGCPCFRACRHSAREVNRHERFTRVPRSEQDPGNPAREEVPHPPPSPSRLGVERAHVIRGALPKLHRLRSLTHSRSHLLPPRP